MRRSEKNAGKFRATWGGIPKEMVMFLKPNFHIY